MGNILQHDFDHILSHTDGLWEDFRDQRIFLTGGTGFFGRWLLESLLCASDLFRLKSEVTVLTRSPDAFARNFPDLAGHPLVKLHYGDVRNFTPPPGRFSHIIHAATDARVPAEIDSSLMMLDTIVDGMRHVLDFAGQSGVRKILFTSSGAVYGRQPPGLSHIPEDYQGGPDSLSLHSVYGEGKRIAELLCSLYAEKFGFEAKIARCFAFIGTGLPLDAHFAIGNFIRDARGGGPIKIKGDGSALRSYLYAADLSIWLWTILVRGQTRHPYNVGSPDYCSISELAQKVARLYGNVAVERSLPCRSDVAPERYVPDVTRAADELGLKAWIPLDLALQRMAGI
jgi:nucleoside-diphosphate-sugar epimerase